MYVESNKPTGRGPINDSTTVDAARIAAEKAAARSAAEKQQKK